MDPISGTIGAFTAGVGALSSMADRANALSLMRQSVEQLQAIGVPSVEAQKLVLERYKQAGIMDPELEQAFTQGDTELKNISVDPRLKESQMNALSSLEEIGNSGGMTLSDFSNLNKVQNDIDSEERGAREAILSNTRQRGQSGSGLELVAQLMNQQSAADRSSEAGLDTAARARGRALEAIMSAGELSGNMRGQEFDEQARVNAAQDVINAFNTKNRQAVSGSNVDRINTAKQYNLDNKQRVMDNNTELSNKEQINNKNLLQQQFDNNMSKATAMASARSGQATAHNNAADRTGAMWTGIGQGIGQLGTAYQQSQRADEQAAKEDKRWDDFMTLMRK